jgi:hypothetical protein
LQARIDTHVINTAFATATASASTIVHSNAPSCIWIPHDFRSSQHLCQDHSVGHFAKPTARSQYTGEPRLDCARLATLPVPVLVNGIDKGLELVVIVYGFSKTDDVNCDTIFLQLLPGFLKLLDGVVNRAANEHHYALLQPFLRAVLQSKLFNVGSLATSCRLAMAAANSPLPFLALQKSLTFLGS